MKPNTLRIGSRVYGVGLTKAVELNGQKGTITRRVHGKRWGIIFRPGQHVQGVAPR
jgi:hypothetical protein